MAERPIERELKLDVDEDFALPDLAGLADGVVVEDLGRQMLVATYLDTDDRRLLDRGVTLRYRDGEAGDGGRWTLKLPVPGRGPTLDRRELVWALPADQRPARAVELVAGLCRGARLVEAAVLRTTRQRATLRDQDGRSLAEIDDDRVEATAFGTPVRFRQIEIELTGGDAALAGAAGRLLLAAGARLSSPEPKLQRVLDAGRTPPDVEATTRLGPGSSMGEVVVASIAAAVDRLLAHDPGVRLGEGTEPVHQARVAVRRLRSDLDVLGSLFEDEWAARAQDDLKALAATLGRVRDIDVLGLRFEADTDDESAWATEGLQALTARLAAERVPAAGDLTAAIGGGRYFALVDRLVAATVDPPWRVAVTAPDRHGPSVMSTTPASEVLPRLLRRRWRQVRATVDAFDDPPSDEQLHTLRKRAKRLRYNAELAAAVLGPAASRLAATAASLQGILGEHHDAVVAEGWLRRAAAAAAPAEAFVAGELVAKAKYVQDESARAWPAAWEKLADKQLRRAIW